MTMLPFFPWDGARVVRPRCKERGIAMVMGMIFLVLLTLLVVSAISSGMVNLRITGNMQAEDEARAVAQQAIEQYASVYANFYPTPVAKAATGFDINNDGSNEYSVSIAAPSCRSASQQTVARTPDCAAGIKAGTFCWDTLWDVTAVATDAKTGVKQTITQGVSITFDPTFFPPSAGC
jgi:Tfp pilus assembly protein PilX